jgi:type IV pilus assembly protein PilW
MVLGLLLMEGVFILFSSTGRVSETQSALARLQENGRIAVNMIADDLRLAGYLPCGSHAQPQVFADTVSNHFGGVPATFDPPADWPANTAYPLDRGVFLAGNTCAGKACQPALVTSQGVPRAGLSEGDKIPGTDVLTVRYLQSNGWAANAGGSKLSCDGKDKLDSIAIQRAPGDPALDGFASTHLALLANCASAQIFPANVQGNTVQPILGKFGAPTCASIDAQTRLFDLDSQLQTSTYYLQVVKDASKPGRLIAALMRRTNGVANELVQGVERLDFRYSLTDADGKAHWLSAAEVARGSADDGSQLQCGMVAAAPTTRCSWSDVSAVELSLLVNTTDDLPASASADTSNYRYSIDDDLVHTPAAIMPVTGLASGRMMRREFRTVVALRNLSA